MAFVQLEEEGWTNPVLHFKVSCCQTVPQQIFFHTTKCGDIVSLYTTESQRHIGQIVEINRQSAKILCQDKIYTQPLSFLSPLYTEMDKENKCSPLVPTDSAPGLGLDSEFEDMTDNEIDMVKPTSNPLGGENQTTSSQQGSGHVTTIDTWVFVEFRKTPHSWQLLSRVSDTTIKQCPR